MRVSALMASVLMGYFIQTCSSANIVVLYGVCTKSHVIAVMPAVEELALRGHQVTVISPFKGIAKNVQNGHEIVLADIGKRIDETEVDWFSMQKQGSTQFFNMMMLMKAISLKASNSIFSHPEFQEIVKKRQIDLFIVDGLFHEFLYPVFDLIKVPFVTHGASSAFPGTLVAMGAPLDYASVPIHTTDFVTPMTFTQRLMNIIPTMGCLISHSIVKSYFPGARDIEEVLGEASICMINSHPMTNWPRSLPPSMIPVGPLHTRPAKTLPQGLKEFADAAKEGLVIFTLGSAVPVSSMPKETLASFIRVFSKFPQRVVWKWEAEMPLNLPSNIMMVKWLPQQDFLGHPNARLFITHGGLLGTQEAAYHGVPMLGLPFGNDQRGNVAKVKREGWGWQLDWDKINDSVLEETLNYLIHDPSIRANASRVSRLMQDEIIPAKEVAVYWMEYVIRHGGAKHLQLSSKNMPFYQRHLIDVALFLILVAVVLSYLCIATIRFVARKRFPGKISKHKLNSLFRFMPLAKNLVTCYVITDIILRKLRVELYASSLSSVIGQTGN
ncbi:UDP-glycosyltransferase UGT5-like [Daphnia carinata]|uniref:UDP-glycosyltransferase UGT5-like n=1 Tax=Daphnia carinata TaxID=120202 RepID=UPI002869243C|nr:UDP-glycosyltransferase UGT5-like [Daphnia carinata]